MKQIPILLWGLLLPFSILQAQAVQGEITDSKQLPIEGATVVGLDAKDSSFVQGTVTREQGHFTLPLRHNGSYLLKTSAVGYKTRYIPFSITDTETAKLSRILMEEDSYALSGITVTAQKVPVEMKVGKTVYNLSATISGTQGNLYDALRQMPGVQIQSNGNILLDGQGGINVLMNGKTTYLSGETLINYLRSIPASTVEKIELINNPSSHLDAAGKTGVINIEIKRINIKGLITGGNAGYNQAYIYGSGYGNIYLNLRKNKFNLYTDYAYYEGIDLNETTMSREYIDLTTQQILDFHMGQQAYRTYAYKSHNFRIAADYELTPHTNLNGYLNGSWICRRGKEKLGSDFYSLTAVPDSSSITRNRLRASQHNLIGGISTGYQSPNKLKWDASFDFQLFGNANKQDQQSSFSLIESSGIYRNNLLKGDMEGDIQIYCGQTNLVVPLSEKTTLGIGGKTTFVSIDNSATYCNKEYDNWQEILSLNNHFIYNENINAGYIALNTSFGKSWKIETGIRVENTNIKGELAGNTLRADSSFTNHYTHIFPFLQMQYQWKDMHQLSFLYSKRIVRPQYRDLNPFVTINDNYLYEQGNTRLEPELAHNTEFSYILKSRYRMSLLASYTRHPITKSYMAEENKRILVLPMNLSSDYSAGIRLSAANLKPFPWWQINTNLLLIYRKYAWQMDGDEYRNKKFTPMLYIGHQLHLPQGWTAELNGYWNGKTPQGQAIISPTWSVSGGISKSMFGGRGTLRLFAENLFSSRHIHIDVFSTTQQGWYQEKMRMKLGVGFSFRFHKGETPKEFTPKSSISESKRINL